MVNTSIPVTVVGRTFPSVKACCEFFGINSTKVYKYKSKNNCSYEEAINYFLPANLASDNFYSNNNNSEEKKESVVEEIKEEETHVVSSAEPTAQEVENESIDEHINEENESMEVNEEMAQQKEVVKTVLSGSDDLSHVSTEERKLTITKVDEKLNIFQKLKRWLFG